MRILFGLFLLVALCASVAVGQDTLIVQDKPLRLGEIDFFGNEGFDVKALRAALPVHEGDAIAQPDLESVVQKIGAAINQSLGKPATDIAPGCCDDHGDLMIYIGLPGKSSSGSRYNPEPKGDIQLPSRVIDLYEQAMALVFESAQTQPEEDRSKGYALSAYPPLRAKQLAMREYALNEERTLINVLTGSSQAEQRRVATHLLGYVRQSRRQINALMFASNDADEVVRNNAVRALAVLAESSPRIAAQIPPAKFIVMLSSGTWKDRNKAALLLETLSRGRNRRLLYLLHKWALDQLVEMARWRSPGHAYPARVMLARIAGMKENQLQQLVSAGDSQAIIDSVARRR